MPKKPKRHTMRLIICFLFLMPSLCFAQPGWMDGYIVTNQRDTIYGKIYYAPPAHRSAKIAFKAEGEKEKVKYRPFTIRGYFVNDQYFVSRIYDIDASLTYGLGVFMRWVNYDKKGHVRIYEYWNTDGDAGYNETLLVRSQGNSYSINPLKFKRDASYFFRDYKELRSDILKGVYKRRDLQKIVERYNAWRRFDKWNEKYKEEG